MSTHFGGVFNCVNKEDITQDMLLSMQGCIHHAFFDLIGEEGFDIRNLTVQQVEKLMAALPEDWIYVKVRYGSLFLLSKLVWLFLYFQSYLVFSPGPLLINSNVVLVRNDPSRQTSQRSWFTSS